MKQTYTQSYKPEYIKYTGVPDRKNTCSEKFLALYPQGKCDLSIAPGTSVKPEEGARSACAVFVFIPCCKSHSDWVGLKCSSAQQNPVSLQASVRLMTGKDSRVLTSSVWVPSRGITQPLHGTGPDLQMRTLKGLLMWKYHRPYSDLGN